MVFSDVPDLGPKAGGDSSSSSSFVAFGSILMKLWIIAFISFTLSTSAN